MLTSISMIGREFMNRECGEFRRRINENINALVFTIMLKNYYYYTLFDLGNSRRKDVNICKDFA